MKKRSKIFILISCIMIIAISKSIYVILNNKYKSINNSSDIAIIVDNQKSKTIPERGLYKVSVECNTGSGEWDYNNWSVNLSDTQKDSKCTLEFTSDMTESEYNKLINEGIGLRRNTYRGKDITKYHEDGSLYTMIENGTFDDIYVGDYIIANDIKWLVADIDNYLYTGDTGFNYHHLTIIPAGILGVSSINSSNTTTGGYYNSEMVQNTLPNVLETYIKPAFGDHVLMYRNLLSNSVDSTVVSPSVTSNLGSVNNWAWYNRQIDLMSEINVYGTNVFSSSGYDTGIDNKQYALFQLKPEFTNYDGQSIGRFSYWLKNVFNSTDFTAADNHGQAGRHSASIETGIRPRFLIG